MLYLQKAYLHQVFWAQCPPRNDRMDKGICIAGIVVGNACGGLMSAWVDMQSMELYGRDTLTEMGTDPTKGRSIPNEMGTNPQVSGKYHLFLSCFKQGLKLIPSSWCAPPFFHTFVLCQGAFQSWSQCILFGYIYTLMRDNMAHLSKTIF